MVPLLGIQGMAMVEPMGSVGPVKPWICTGRHHGRGTADCPRNLHHHHDEKCTDPTKPTAPLTPSVVTSRHWTREGLDQPLRSIELRDGAQSVIVLHHDDEALLVKTWSPFCGTWMRPVYCGPSALYPTSPNVRINVRADGRIDVYSARESAWLR